jgi:uncharacterized protein YndB with AHSA1/START domain
MTFEIVEEVIIQASAPRVWSALLDTASWWPEISIDPASGGVFEDTGVESGSAQKTRRGTIVGFVPGERVRLSWKEDTWPGGTEVLFDIVPQGAGETKAVLHHTGWEVFPETERSGVINAHAERWRHHLRQLKTAAES